VIEESLEISCHLKFETGVKNYDDISIPGH